MIVFNENIAKIVPTALTMQMRLGGVMIFIPKMHNYTMKTPEILTLVSHVSDGWLHAISVPVWQVADNQCIALFAIASNFSISA